MLTVLKIRNLALVDDLTWELGEGLVGVTGETGAGKSMIVGALKLILGERADRGLIRAGAADCTVEAVFRLGNAAEVNAFLEERGFEIVEGDELIVKRAFSAAGANKQFINCSPATLSVLRELGNMLVDLHGPHDHQALLSCDRQLSMLDAYARAEEAAGRYREAYRRWRERCDELDDLRNAERAGEQEIDLLRFQVNEIESAGLAEGDDVDLERRYRIASNSKRLLESSRQILSHLSTGDGSVLGRLEEVHRSIQDLERLDPKIAEITQGFAAAQVELEELARGIEEYAEGLEIDPAAVAELERRVDLLETLKRKYGNTVEEIIAFGAEAARKLEKTENRGEELARLEAAAAAAREELEKAGRKLSELRRRTAPKLAREISSHLGDLGLLRARFGVELKVEDRPGPRGMEGVEFVFGPNPGEPPKALRVVASSGEMSRVMLAVKSALADQDSIPLMVFDEIDANVGGEIAHSVGAKMASLGKRHQVVSITHLPQVAAVAHCHYVVRKEFESDKTRSLLQKVDGESRVAEIARMLGGGGEPELALAGILLAGRATQ